MKKKGGIEMRLTKSKDDAMVSGVLGGLGEYYNVDPTFLRIAFVVLMFMTPLPVIPLYIVGAVVIPEGTKSGDDVKRKYKRKPRQPKRNPREFKEYTKYDKVNEKSSPRKDVTEDDWSDF